MSFFLTLQRLVLLGRHVLEPRRRHVPEFVLLGPAAVVSAAVSVSVAMTLTVTRTGARAFAFSGNTDIFKFQK